MEKKVRRSSRTWRWWKDEGLREKSWWNGENGRRPRGRRREKLREKWVWRGKVKMKDVVIM